MTELKIESIEEQGYGKKVTLSNGHSHWIPNANWKTQDELREAVLNAESQAFGIDDSDEKEDVSSLVGQKLKKE